MCGRNRYGRCRRSIRLTVSRGRTFAIAIGGGVISVRGGDQRQQREKRKRRQSQPLQQGHHLELSPEPQSYITS